ncbi:radical SAM protein [Streptomyces sp. NPDC004647]|uniref:radical SAM protein n=1 Tax=Streptomyces sp. NPDC004647 TaxID=3154671 RepID=UPI0033B11B39
MPGLAEELPESICVRVTRRCNAACSFCQAPPTSRAEISVHDIGRMARFFARNGVRSLKLSGGEPTVRDDLPEIIRAVAAAGPRPVVITNGIAVPERVMGACAEVGGEFKFSVHRPSRENDAILRRRSFDAVRENMAAVVGRKIRLSVNCVVTPVSAKLMAEMIEFACEVGAGKISFIPVVARGRAREKGEFSFSPGELDAVIERMRELARLYAERIVVRCIDIRSHDYWIVENDGSLWVERATEEADRRICGKQLLAREESSIEGVA